MMSGFMMSVFDQTILGQFQNMTAGLWSSSAENLRRWHLHLPARDTHAATWRGLD